MIRRRLEELDDLVAAMNQECDQPTRFFLRMGQLWCNEGNGYQVTPTGLTKNELYQALQIFLAGIVAGKRYGKRKIHPREIPAAQLHITFEHLQQALRLNKTDMKPGIYHYLNDIIDRGLHQEQE